MNVLQAHVPAPTLVTAGYQPAIDVKLITTTPTAPVIPAKPSNKSMIVQTEPPGKVLAVPTILNTEGAGFSLMGAILTASEMPVPALTITAPVTTLAAVPLPPPAVPVLLLPLLPQVPVAEFLTISLHALAQTQMLT